MPPNPKTLIPFKLWKPTHFTVSGKVCGDDSFRYAITIHNNKFIAWKDFETKENLEAADCVKACVEATWECKSVDYYKSTKKCYLAKVSEGMVDVDLTGEFNWVYYGIHCEGKVGFTY
jgi:hypothetical protein